jgi:crossover junction endodeoxyribonuclease RusA
MSEPPRVHLYRVIGRPAPQGSKRHVGNGRMVESSADVGPWRDAVALQVAAQRNRAGWRQECGAIKVAVTFLLARPPSVRRMWPEVRPDLSKLLRATEDALTDSGVIRDDALIVEVLAKKRYAPEGGATGAWIRIEPLT